jgi:hypothetical protein
VLLLDHAIAAAEDIDMLADVADLKQTGLHAIVEVRRKVSDLVGKIDQLRLERRPLIEQVAGELWMLLSVVVA